RQLPGVPGSTKPRGLGDWHGGRRVMGRGATIRAGFLAAVCTAGAPIAFGQAPDATKPANNANPQAAVPADPAKLQHVLELWASSCARLDTLDVTIFRRNCIVDWDE